MNGLGEITLLQIQDLGIVKYMALKLNEKGALTKVVGPNDSGKSTILDSIKYAIEGAAAIPDNSIRNGQDRALVRIETSNGYEIVRKLRRKDGDQVEELEVKVNGAPIKSAQKFLSSLSARFPDPQDIADKSGEELRKALMTMLEGSTSFFAKAIDEVKINQVVVRKQIKDLGAEPYKPEGIDESAAVPLEKLQQDAQVAADLHAKIKAEQDRAANERESFIRELASLRAEKERLLSRLAEIDAKIEEIEGEDKVNEEGMARRSNVLLSAFAEKERTGNLLQSALKSSAELERLKAWKEWTERKKALDEQYATNDENQKKLEAARRKAIEDAKFGAENLRLTEDEVFLGDTPWDRSSTSARLIAGAKLAAATIPEGGLRVLYIHRGESIGREKMEALAQFARASGISIFVEVMTDDEPAEQPGLVYIRAGDIRFGAEGEPAKQVAAAPRAPVAPSTESELADDQSLF